MNILLDTHVALWAITDSEKFSRMARAPIESAKATVWISAASLWEIAIKHSLGRGDMPISGQRAVSVFRESGYRFLAVEIEHAIAVEKLPAHHQDPFDRLLVAQAQARVEPMRLLTLDSLVARCSDTIIHDACIGPTWQPECPRAIWSPPPGHRSRVNPDVMPGLVIHEQAHTRRVQVRLD